MLEQNEWILKYFLITTNFWDTGKQVGYIPYLVRVMHGDLACENQSVYS